jgi:hypothetical protein
MADTDSDGSQQAHHIKTFIASLIDSNDDPSLTDQRASALWKDLSAADALLAWRAIDRSFSSFWRDAHKIEGLLCSLCYKHQDDVHYLVQGRSIAICDECMGRAKLHLLKSKVRNKFVLFVKFTAFAITAVLLFFVLMTLRSIITG